MKYTPVFSLLCAMLLFSCNGGNDDATEPITGCTDPQSVTYNPEATENDGSCKYVEEKNTALFSFVTSTTCWACGSYGEESKDKIVHQSLDDLVAMSIHMEFSKLGNQTAVDVADGLVNRGGYPLFMVNKSWWQGADLEENAEIGFEHVQKFLEEPVVAGMYGRYEVNSNMEITCEVWSKFFLASEGKYRVAVYVLEDDVMAGQAPTSYLEIPHYDVLRDVVSETLGTPINEDLEAMYAGEVNSFEFSKKLENVLDQENIKVVGVLLNEMENGNLAVVNSCYLEKK